VGGPGNPEAWARASNVDIAERLTGKLLLIHGGMDDQVHPDQTLRLADRLIAADKDFELLIMPGAEQTYIDCLAYVRKRCWDFLVRELMGTQPAAYRPSPSPSTPHCSARCSHARGHHRRGTIKTQSPPAITTTGLCKSAGDKVVLDCIGLVPEGTTTRSTSPVTLRPSNGQAVRRAGWIKR
jgi:Prolyl oligopeptidase family